MPSVRGDVHCSASNCRCFASAPKAVHWHTAAIKYMMRIAELLENITPYGSLSPAEYTAVAQQRDAALKQKRQAAQQGRQQQQKIRQQQVWAKSRAAKPKPIKWKAVPRRRVRRKARAV